MDKWLIARIVRAAVASIRRHRELQVEAVKDKMARIAKELDVGRSSLYNWGKVQSDQVPDVIQIMRLLWLASPEVRAEAITALSKQLGIYAEIKIEGAVSKNLTQEIDWDAHQCDEEAA